MNEHRDLSDLLKQAREAAHLDIADPRERAIIVRYIEDAMCRLRAAHDMSPLPPRA